VTPHPQPGATSLGSIWDRTRCTGLGAVLAAIAVAAVLATPPVARAALQPIGLSVDGGEETWHSSSAFTVRWNNPAGVAAVHYRLLDPAGVPVFAQRTLSWPASAVEFTVPLTPGNYTAEVWLEDSNGSMGPPDTARLRFDNTAPSRVETAPVTAWIGRTDFPYTVHLGHPSGLAPPSGIHGYAVSIDRDPNGTPCVGKVCGEDEIDLHDGVDDDRIAIGELPEGTSFLHAVAVSGSRVRSATPSSTVMRVDKTDPTTRLDGVPSGWSDRPLTVTATATDAASGMTQASGGPPPFTAIQIDGGSPVRATGNTVSAAVLGSGFHTVAFYARDAAGNVADGGNANGEPNHAPSTALVKIDADPPRLAFSGAQNPRDPERIEVRVSDGLSGIDPSAGEIAVRPAGSGKRFSPLPTETPGGGVLRARWNSEAQPAGEYEFRAVVHDLAGNSASTTSRAGGAPMRLRAPLKAATKLVADSDLRTLTYGRGTWFSGRLIVGRRAALAGMPVRVVERFDAGATTRERISTATTRPDGAFGVYLAAGPSREVLAVAPATATTQSAGAQPLRLDVRGRLGLRVSARVAHIGGRPVVFTGTVSTSGAKLPAEGKVVELQFRLPGLPWREFRTVRTSPNGHFHYSYSFTDDDSQGVSFQFRAVAPAQQGWPYLPAKSRPVDVRGA
jgi:hypothetical protein